MKYSPITINREPALIESEKLALYNEELNAKAEGNFLLAVAGLVVILVLIAIGIYWVLNL